MLFLSYVDEENKIWIFIKVKTYGKAFFYLVKVLFNHSRYFITLWFFIIFLHAIQFQWCLRKSDIFNIYQINILDRKKS